MKRVSQGPHSLFSFPRKGGWGRPILILLPVILLIGCSHPASETTVPPPVSLQSGDRSAGAFEQTDPWLLTTKNPLANRGNHGIFLGNGYLGATFGPGGGATKDTVCYAAGVYDENENLLALPNWQHDGLPESGSGPFQQTLDMKRGILTGTIGTGTTEAFVSGDNLHLAAQRISRSGEHTNGKPAQTDVKTVTGFAEVKPVTVAVATLDEDPVGGNDTCRYVAIYTSRDTPDPKAAAAQAVTAAAKTGFDALEQKHEAAWAKLWANADIQIDGDAEAQQLVHKLMFDLLQSARPGGSESVPPETLSGNFYKGHIFWDAEVWMFPALLAQHPDIARTILDYRYKRLEAAKGLAKTEGFKGADFPWESASTGKETAPGGFKEGRHVTAGVGWAAWQYYQATGDKAWMSQRGWPLLSSIADYFASRAKKNPQTGKYNINQVFGPDELTGTVNNNTYTNAMARNCLLYAGEAAKIAGKPVNPQWAIVAKNLALPFDKITGHYLTRENDDGKSVKQADGELVIYPAALPMDDTTAAKTFDFNKTRPIKNGPAMTASIHALIAARLGRATEAEQYFRDSYKPFIRGPFLLFSEKRSLDRCVFTTGAGGVLQSVLYGFGGLDFSRPGGLIAGKPALPASWRKLTITGIHRGGKIYTLVVTPEKRTLTEEKAGG